MTSRREFLKGVVLSAGAGIAAGGAREAHGAAAGAPMRNFRCAPMAKGIRVGVVGVGAREGPAERLSHA